MGLKGSKHGGTCKLEKRRAKQHSSKKTDLFDEKFDRTLAQENGIPSHQDPNSCLEKIDGRTYHTPTSKDSNGFIAEDSHNTRIQNRRSNCSAEYLSKRSEQDNISRELALTSSPHYKSHELFREDSSYGDDVKTSHLINSGETLSPNRDSNFEITQSEHYSNTLGSQDGITVSSSIEDIICGGGDLGDSGCHFEQLANKYFSTQSVRKVILDLSQIKYVGLSLVGGADSPFGNLPVLVKEIMPGGAAERCDIARGDEIIGINSYSLEDKPLQFAVERLRHCSCRDKEIILWLIPQTD